MLGQNSRPIQASLHDHSEFLVFLAGRPEACDPAAIARSAEQIRQRGRALTSRFGWARTNVVGSNYREDIHIMGLPGRVHALLHVLDERAAENTNPDVLWFDGAKRLAREFHSAYPGLICCAPDAREAAQEDPQQLTVDPCIMGFVEQSFDAIVFNENLHLQADLKGVLKECARVLRPRGVLLATFPFACSSGTAKSAGPSAQGRSNHHTSHVLGWEIVEFTQRCGFADCCMVYISDAERGILGGDLDGIFVLAARVRG